MLRLAEGLRPGHQAFASLLPQLRSVATLTPIISMIIGLAINTTRLSRSTFADRN